MNNSISIDINADMGEGFGRWILGNDAALMPHVTSANIACGFHAGDPHIMRECVRLAKVHGVGVGAHVGFLDLMGFGRRRTDLTPSQLRDHVVYQVGALIGFALVEGVRVEHVKPHSALYKLCMENTEYAEALAGALEELDSNLILLLSGEIAERAASRAGLRFIGEGFIDLDYDENGAYVPEWPKRSWPPERVAERALLLAHERKITLRNGARVAVSADSVCIHGDADNAAQVAQTVRHRLEQEGVEVVPLRKILERRA
jgi:5-oxoprolinase (ATP-hydrolysing) subunit A